MASYLMYAASGIVCVLLCISVYYYYQFAHLDLKLNTKTREDFVKELGCEYQKRPLNMTTFRYKWFKGPFIIRADFDNGGILIGGIKVSCRYFRKSSGWH